MKDADKAHFLAVFEHAGKRLLCKRVHAASEREEASISDRGVQEVLDSHPGSTAWTSAKGLYFRALRATLRRTDPRLAKTGVPAKRDVASVKAIAVCFI